MEPGTVPTNLIIPENEKKVICLIEAGHPRKEAEALLGLSSTRIHQIITKAGSTLCSNAKCRLIEEFLQDEESSQIICSIFAIENFTYEWYHLFFLLSYSSVRSIILFALKLKKAMLILPFWEY